MKMKRRLIAIWRILTKRNFILIEVEEFIADEIEIGSEPDLSYSEFIKDNKGRIVRTLVRTDYSIESDLLTLEAAKVQLTKK